MINNTGVIIDGINVQSNAKVQDTRITQLESITASLSKRMAALANVH